MDLAPIQSVLVAAADPQVLTTPEWLGVIAFLIGGDIVLIGLLYNGIMSKFEDGKKRFDKIDIKIEGQSEESAKQGRNIARIYTKLDITEEI